jgi:hypothetical protein
MAMDRPETATGPLRAGGQTWPARSGAAPPLADGFITRPESVPGLPAALARGSVVALVNSEPLRRAGPSGKTQLAVFLAKALWRADRVDLLAWVDAPRD